MCIWRVDGVAGITILLNLIALAMNNGGQKKVDLNINFPSYYFLKLEKEQELRVFGFPLK